MTKAELASYIKFRQNSQKVLPPMFLAFMATFSDDKVLDLFITCPECEAKAFSKEELDRVIAQSATPDDFMECFTRSRNSHPCNRGNAASNSKDGIIHG